MLITEAIRAPTFANHESFHLRQTWLKKAYDEIKTNPQIFVSSEAIADLGVGKNMVKSIRSWGIASKVFESTGKLRDPSVRLTKMGHLILGDKGFDPDLDNNQTLWLIHWLLLAPPCRIPVWWMIMNDFPATNVSIPEMTESIINRINTIPEWKTPTPKSIKKDIDVFFHTYMIRQDKNLMINYMNTPLSDINLVEPGKDKDSFQFAYGIKSDMSPMIVAFACLDFVDRMEITAKEISIARLASEAGGIGNTFKISERDIAEMLREACKSAKLSKIVDVNGAPHLTFKDPKKAALEMLDMAYGKKQQLPPITVRNRRSR